MERYQAEVLIGTRFALSEGPVWEAATQTLHFVDIKGCALHTLHLPDGKQKSLDVSQNIGCFALRKQGGYVMGLAAGVYLLNGAYDRIEKLKEPDIDPMTRFNDGKCDPQGRFWCGTSDQYDYGHYLGGKLYCLPGDGRCIEMMDKLGCSNGLGFRGDQVYFIDSVRHCVERYTLDEGTMTLRDRREVVHIDPSIAVPDGMTMDEDGKLWVAHWGGGFVGRYDPDSGELLARVEVPASQSSSCCFGGSDMQTLFITSASVGRDDEPHAGNVFAIHLPYRGVDSPKYNG